MMDGLLDNAHGHGGGHGHGHGHGHAAAQTAMQAHGSDCCCTHSDAAPSQSYRPNGWPDHSTAQGGGSGLSWKDSMDWLRMHDPAECTTSNHLGADCEIARCDHSELTSTTNVIVMVRASELIAMSRVNSILAITAVLYIAVNLVCTILNSYDNDCDRSLPDCSPATTPQLFHNLEFWATFVFNTVDVFALSYSPKNLSNQYGNPTLLKIVVLFNVGMSFLACMLVAINLEKFEVLAHELEYTNELTITIFDATILLNLVRGRSHKSSDKSKANFLSALGLAVIAMVGVAQIVIYNCSGWTADGDSKGEQTAHYLEFAFGTASAGITFWFTMDNKMSADQRLRQIMYSTGSGIRDVALVN